MPIAVKCIGCDRTMQVKEEFAGLKARCPYCQGVVQVPTPPKPRILDAEAFDPDRDEGSPRRRRSSKSRDDRDDDEPRGRRRDRRDDRDDDDDYIPRRPRRVYFDEDEDEYSKRGKRPRSSSSTGSIVGGLAMMLIAVIWFCAGLAGDVIFFFPPVLFICGIVTLVNGANRR